MVKPWTDEVIEFLNEVAGIDPVALLSLVENRVPCNSVLGDHRSVQVSTEDGHDKVGLLGFLNGLCGTIEGGMKAGWGPITMVRDGNNLTFKRTPE